jgi:phage regulator Rha-like protein
MKTSRNLADETNSQHGEVKRVLHRLMEVGFIRHFSEEEAKAAGGKGGRNQKLIILSDADFDRVIKHLGSKRPTFTQKFQAACPTFTAYRTSRQLAGELGKKHCNILATIRRVVSRGWLAERMFAEGYYEKRGRKLCEISIEFMAYEWLVDYIKCNRITGRVSQW